MAVEKKHRTTPVICNKGSIVADNFFYIGKNANWQLAQPDIKDWKHLALK